MWKSTQKLIKLILKKFGLEVVKISQSPNPADSQDWCKSYPCETYDTHKLLDVDKELLNRFNTFIQNNLNLLEFKNKICRLYYSKKWELGKGVLYPTSMFYQSFEKLQIEGQRPTTFRFYTYGLDKLLQKNHQVLDIGCNCGFFALHISEYVNSVDGVEFNKELVEIADVTKEYLNINNCHFHFADFRKFVTNKKYDVIFSFAVHYWIGMSMKEYALQLSNLLNPNGFVVFESQDISTIDSDFDEKIKEFCENGFKVIYGGSMMTGKDYPRKFMILLKHS